MSELCPICQRNETIPVYRPFCSKRCADLDLNKWLTASYAIPAHDPPDEYDALPDENDDPDNALN